MLNFSDNTRELERHLSDALLQQLPFALSLALNDTGADVAEAWRDEMSRVFDRPTPFTLRGPHLQRRAQKTRLTAVVAIRPNQAEYLRIQVTGGTRYPNGAAVLVPRGARLNRYGNLPRNYVRNLINSGRGFVASRSDPLTAHLPPGIYRRRRVRGRGTRPELLVAFEDQAEYNDRLDIEGIARLRANAAFPRHVSRRLQQAWATRRR